MKHALVFSPAKINLFLAITGRRADGFHDLVSVAAPVSLGDTIRIEYPAAAGTDGAGRTGLVCPGGEAPSDGSNLVLRAAEAFRAETGWRGGVDFFLEKRVPSGAGLGGGSSNAARVLLALNDAVRASGGAALGAERLAQVAAGIGSDCALFLQEAPVVMRGRGERLERLPGRAARRLSGRRVLIFKPGVSVSTGWAYQQLAARAPGGYLPEKDAEARLAAWIGGDAGAEDLLYNNMEPPVFGKYAALPVLLAQLRARFGVAAGMSGSGSACFALLREDAAGAGVAREMAEFVRAAWGRAAFVAEAGIL